MISVVWKRLFQLVTGLTGVSEALLGLIIVFFASHLQQYIDTGVLPEPLYLRILGVMDFYIGVAYILISFQPDKNYILNKWTCFLRLGLSAVFLVEGVWLLEAKGLRLIYQSLAVFDFFLFSIQAVYIQKTGETPPVK
mgnify:CR=1 FL=1